MNTATLSALSQERLIADLADAQVVYVGESHTNSHHHAIQLALIKGLVETNPQLTIGMEMFDHTYQPVLDQWTAGELDQADFIKKTHWYANWRFDFALYRDILNFIKENRQWKSKSICGFLKPTLYHQRPASGSWHGLKIEVMACLGI